MNRKGTSLLMNRWLILLLRLILAGFFLRACIPKIIDSHDFALAVFRYQMLPYDLVNIAAVFLPWTELVASLFLLFGKLRWRCAGLAVITGMLLLFTVAIAINVFRGVDIACGCFSVSADAEKMGWLNVMRNILLLCACGWLAIFELLQNRKMQQ